MRSYVILSVFPTGVFRKVYTTYLLSSKLYGFSHIELKETIIMICHIIFSLYFFHWVLKEFSMIYQIALFSFMSFPSKFLIKGLNEATYAILSIFPHWGF